MLYQTDSAAGVAANSAPGLLYVVCKYLIDLPIEKWVSIATFLLVALQIAFLLKDRMKKRSKRGAQ